jgi:phosphatidylglycerophosphate synthase
VPLRGDRYAGTPRVRNEHPWQENKKSQDINEGPGILSSGCTSGACGFGTFLAMSEPGESANYNPVSRRPIADAFRRTAAGAVNFCVRFGIHPDVISYLSVVASAAAAICFWQSRHWPIVFLILAPALCYLRLWFNMLDGMVAIAGKTASLRGEILNDLPDRISDVLIFVGVAHSGWGNPFIAYWAAIFALLTAYVGTLGQAVAGRREFAGVMSKPWRMVTLQIGSTILLVMILTGRSNISLVGLSVIDCTCVIVIAGCVQTICMRLARSLSVLKTKKAGM